MFNDIVDSAATRVEGELQMRIKWGLARGLKELYLPMSLVTKRIK